MDPLFEDPRWTELGLFVEAHDAVVAAIEQAAPPGPDRDVRGVLIQLVRSPDERLRMTDLARAMSLHPSRVTRIVDRGVAAGLLERQQCPDDRRVSYAVLTADGRRTIRAEGPELLEVMQRTVFDHLSARERRTLTSLMRRLRDRAQEQVACGTHESGPT